MLIKKRICCPAESFPFGRVGGQIGNGLWEVSNAVHYHTSLFQPLNP